MENTKLNFQPLMKKLRFKLIDKEYWLSDREGSSVEGLPVFSNREMKILLEMKENVTKDFLEKCYNIKLITSSTLMEIKIEAKMQEEKEKWEDQYKKSNKNLTSETGKESLKEIFKILGKSEDVAEKE